MRDFVPMNAIRTFAWMQKKVVNRGYIPLVYFNHKNKLIYDPWHYDNGEYRVDVAAIKDYGESNIHEFADKTRKCILEDHEIHRLVNMWLNADGIEDHARKYGQGISNILIIADWAQSIKEDLEKSFAYRVIDIYKAEKKS